MAARGSGDEEEERGKVGLHSLFRFADASDVLLMVAGAAGAVANGVSQPLMTLLFGEVIEAFGSASRHDVLHRVSEVCLKFFYLAIGSWFACFLQVTCWMITGERQAARIRGLYLEAVLRQDIAFSDKEMTTRQVVERMSGDTMLIQDAIGEKVGKFIQLTSTFMGGFVVAFTKGWLLSSVMLSSIPPIVIAGATMSWIISNLSTQGQSKYNEAGNIVEQTIGAIRTVTSFNGENRATALYSKYIGNAYVCDVQEGTATGLSFGFFMFIIFCTYGLTAWYGAKLITDKGYGGGQVVSVWMAFMTGAMSLGEATPCLTAFASGQAAGYRMMRTIRREPEIYSDGIDGIVLENLRGDIEMRNVYFSYPSRPDRLIFDGFSLHVLCGTIMAIVGESGSGKSTVINLLERFYDPQTGQVLIDGVNIKNLRLGHIRKKIGLVCQEPLLFATTIRENIVYGRDDATTEEIMVAAELANAAKFIEKLPNGLDTMVGEHGAQLSGGQKQRIAITRAILKNPKILLLDEATSALDLDSERVVQEALGRVMRDRTTVIVAHRLSTIKDADIISVVQRGRVVEQGTHVELLKNPVGYLQIKFLEGFSSDAKVMYEEATQVANDAVSGIRTVASFCAEHKVMKAYYKKCEAPVRQGIRQGIVSGLGFGVSFFVLYCTYALCFYVGAKFVLDGKATFTEVFRVFFALLMATIGVSQTSALGSDSAKAKESASSIFALIDRKSRIDSSSDDGMVLADVAGELELYQVCFSYPSRPSVQIFRDLSLRIPPGKTVALVGESGCGKSTVIALLERFYDPDSGMVMLDGVDIKNLKVGWLRQQMGLVSQEPVLFNDTIRANIAYGKQGEATEDEIIAVAKAANAHQFISSLPRGYDTCTGERGSQLSGGQKQRVAIASAMLKDPRIPLLDEATSALDAESEHAVQEALDWVMVGRTTVVVAHRPSTIKDADIIAVLRNGEVVAMGRHEQLMALKDGVYASLVELHMGPERTGKGQFVGYGL
ncbi:hypothetical protein ACQ4PT_018635 [Festuca glaucescens]